MFCELGSHSLSAWNIRALWYRPFRRPPFSPALCLASTRPPELIAFAALFFFAILTLWVPAYWPVTVFQVGIFALAGIAVLRARLSPPPFAWPFIPLSFAVLWGLFQLLTGRTAYAFDTQLAVLRWATFLCVFMVAISLFREDTDRRWFRSAITWFAFFVAILATIQTFTSQGRVFWLSTPHTPIT